ncbi:hypothetical protein ACFWEJ_02455 [Promicromonospora sp. NPDC060204]|uniref:hypothetical protein n=1 Tax=Promicromonospora sp. NPDC060204 TaxID=3347071 RepID=UPI0036576A72
MANPPFVLESMIWWIVQREPSEIRFPAVRDVMSRALRRMEALDRDSAGLYAHLVARAESEFEHEYLDSCFPEAAGLTPASEVSLRGVPGTPMHIDHPDRRWRVDNVDFEIRDLDAAVELWWFGRRNTEVLDDLIFDGVEIAVSNVLGRSRRQARMLFDGLWDEARDAHEKSSLITALAEEFSRRDIFQDFPILYRWTDVDGPVREEMLNQGYLAGRADGPSGPPPERPDWVAIARGFWTDVRELDEEGRQDAAIDMEVLLRGPVFRSVFIFRELWSSAHNDDELIWLLDYFRFPFCELDLSTKIPEIKDAARRSAEIRYVLERLTS